MTSGLCSNTYQVYKSYTSDVSQWLLNNSGFHAELEKQPRAALTNNPPPSGAGRLKGKARKLAKSTGTSSTAGSTASNVEEKVLETPISVDQLVEMAQMIADDPAKMRSVPKSVITKLEKTIFLRRQYMNFYAAKPPSKKANEPSPRLQQDNIKHGYFVLVLCRVLEILKPNQRISRDAGEQPRAKADDVPPESSEATHSANNFHLLSVEDMENEDDDQPDQGPIGQAGPTSNTSIRQKAILKERDETEEVFFAIFCLFTDMHRLRLLIRDHWQQYKARSIDLETVTLMSNLATAALRQTEIDFIQAFGHHFPNKSSLGYKDISTLIYFSICLERGVDPNNRVEPNDSYNYEEMSDVGEAICLTAFSTLLSLRAVVCPNKIPSRIPGVFGIYDRNADRSKMSYRQMADQDRALLLDVFPEFCLLEAGHLPDRFQDEFTRSMRRLFDLREDTISVWQVFTTQLFLEASAALGPDITRPFEELQTAARQVDLSLNRFFASRVGQPDFELWPQQNTERLRSFQEQIVRAAILGDPISLQKAKYRGFMDAGPPFYLHKQHPLICGLELLGLRLLMQDAGSTVAAAWGSILYTTHAYNAFRQIGALDVQWPQIEWIISYHTPEKLFAGFTPTTLEQCFKSYNLLMGTSVSCFTPSVRRQQVKKGTLFSSRGPRDWTADSKTLEILKDWAIGKDPAGRPDSADHILARLMALEDASTPRASRDARPVGAVGKILAVKSMFETELPCLQFDYLALHLKCMDLFRAMRCELDEHFSKLVGPTYIENENQLCMMVGWIFLISSQNQKALTEMCEKKVTDNVASVSVVTAAKVMKESILKDGTID